MLARPPVFLESANGPGTTDEESFFSKTLER